MKMHCLVVDDEPLARRVLVNYISFIHSLTLAAECGSAEEAAAFLHLHSVDVMFLDIKMPGLTGLDFLDTLTDPPRVILTTAYPEYALDGYEYSVVDYLLKPVSFERFLKAVNKLVPAVATGRPHREVSVGSAALDSICLRADRMDHKIRFGEIVYIESYGNFVKVHLDRETMLVSETMVAMEKALPSSAFLRVHRSFIASLSRIEAIGSRVLRVGDVEIPVGRSYRRKVADVVKSHLRG